MPIMPAESALTGAWCPRQSVACGTVVEENFLRVISNDPLRSTDHKRIQASFLQDNNFWVIGQASRIRIISPALSSQHQVLMRKPLVPVCKVEIVPKNVFYLLVHVSIVDAF